MNEYLLRVRNDRPDLDLQAGDALKVRAQDTAETGQIVTLTSENGEVSLAHYDGSGRVSGLVLEMSRRV